MRRSAVVAVTLLAALVAPAGAHAASTPYVVSFRDAAVADVDAKVDGLQQRLGFTATMRYATALKGFAAPLTGGQRDKVAADPDVASVETDRAVAGASAGATVPLAGGDLVPPGIRRIGAATTALAHPAAARPVAVLDSGIDLAGADLSAVSGVNCIKPGTPAQDDNGHGTHVAGILAARNGSGGVVGVAPGTRLYSVKVLGSNGSGSLSQLVCGINWVAQNGPALGIAVANMSVAGAGANDNNCGRTKTDTEHQAICGATSAGITFVVAAGNNAKSFAASIPAAYPEVLTTTAVTDTDGAPGGAGPVAACRKSEKDDTIGTYSNFAATTADAAHAIAAPGTCVVSDKRGGGTVTYYGTSQAAPHAAGALALCFDGPCAGLTPAQAIARLRADAATGTFTGATSTKIFGPLVRADPY